MHKIENINNDPSLRSKISKWRFIALFLALIIISNLYKGNQKPKDVNFINKGEYIARLKVTGLIHAESNIPKLIKRLASDQNVKGVILHINSPGGTSVGGEVVYNAVRTLSKEKPVVASITELGASAAYMIAIGSDRIFAHNSSMTGSIGAVMEIPEFKELMDKIGVNFNIIRSKPAKASPSIFEKLDDESRKRMQNLINDNYEFFKTLVYSRRNIKDEHKEKIVSGEVFIGSKALELGLIDEIGGENEIIDWFKKEYKFINPKVHTYKDKKKSKLQDILKLSNRISNFINKITNRVNLYL